MRVPRRDVNPELQAVFTASLRKFAHQIPFPIFKIGVFYGIIGGFGRPETEAIVVLRGEDNAFHASGFQGQDPLLAVDTGRVEGVQPKMDEGVGFKLLPFKLLLSWDGITWFGSFGARDKHQTSKKR